MDDLRAEVTSPAARLIPLLDQPSAVEGATRHHWPNTYVICTTPRSGSNFLCQTLASSGMMGSTRELYWEFFGSTPLRHASPPGLDGPDAEEHVRCYLDDLLATKSSPNGMFGVKLFFNHLLLASRYACIREFLRTARFVWLTRQDIVAQAISRYIAIELDAWTSHAERGKHVAERRNEVEYDAHRIARLVDGLRKDNAGWEEFFALNRLEVFHVTYEELVNESQEICRAICEYCGVTGEVTFAADVVHVEKQASSVNRRFAERFASEAGYPQPRGPA